MLRVLTLSTLFPDVTRPGFGGFVARQTMGLAALPDVEVVAVAPLGLPPGPLSRHPHWRALSGLPRLETWRGLTVHRPRFPVVPVIGARWSARLMTRALLPVLRYIREGFPFDVIDAEFFWPDGPAALAMGRALGVPVSIKARGSDIHHWSGHPAIRRQIVSAGREADGVLAVSAALARDMARLGIPAPRIRTHHTGVDHALFAGVDRIAAKHALGITGPLIVTAGHLNANKGQSLVVEAIAALPGATLLLAGEGPARGRIEARIAELGLGDRVRLLGNVPHGDLPALLGAADVMALPSASEGLANVWVEALAAGTPIVITDVGGAREVVRNPTDGRVVARNRASIAGAIADLLADPPDQQVVRASARRFCWDRNAAELAAHLDGLVRR